MERIIIDTDPGQDDAIAVILATTLEKIDVAGVTTVAGNTSLKNATRNALGLLELIGRRDVPVAEGASGPLVGTQVHAEHVHGANGMGGAILPEPMTKVDKRRAAVFISEMAAECPGEISVVAIGPMTNIALAIKLDPRLVQNLKRLVFMGGGSGAGNVTPSAEFNIYADPEAARIVFDAASRGLVTTMVALDLTRQVLFTDETLARIREIRNPVADFTADIMEHHMANNTDKFGLGGYPLHDPCAVAYVAMPELFVGTPAHVDVELSGELTRGRTVCDFHGSDPNVTFLTQAMSRELLELVIELVSRY
ncbi:nucleoside hydrolase [Candidatus Hydrogenedentota bacterium]